MPHYDSLKQGDEIAYIARGIETKRFPAKVLMVQEKRLTIEFFHKSGAKYRQVFSKRTGRPLGDDGGGKTGYHITLGDRDPGEFADWARTR